MPPFLRRRLVGRWRGGCLAKIVTVVRRKSTMRRGDFNLQCFSREDQQGESMRIDVEREEIWKGTF